MKIIIFGTGNIYTTYKKYIDMDTVVCFIDNAPAKHGTCVAGKKVLYPDEADLQNCDYVLIMTMAYQEMARQLLRCGVEETRIKNYKDLGEIYKVKMQAMSGNEEYTLRQWADMHMRKIFVFSHTFARTGVPVALLHLSILLRKMGWNVLYGALDEGNLVEELKENGIDYIENVSIFFSGAEFVNLLSEFNAAILGTLLLAEAGTRFAEFNIPIIWWLHESDRFFYDTNRLPVNDNFIWYFAGGTRVEKVFKEYYPDKEIEKLLYFLPEIRQIQKKASDIFTFAMVGWYQKRKGQDILIQAFEMMPAEKRKQARMILVCPGFTNSDQRLQNMLRESSEIQLLGELSQEQLELIYEQVDVFVCPSRDDPMPVVVTQAMQNKIPCIVSDQVGQSEFFVGGYGGYVFESENVKELSDLMVYCIDHADETGKKGVEARDIFEENFSENVMRQKIQGILEKIK